MQTKNLGHSDLAITPLGIGAWAIGGAGYRFAWGHQDDAESIAAIRRGVELGINWVDTAAVYGLGHSEEVVGKAIRGLANPPYVFTKCERNWDAEGQIVPCLKAAAVKQECEDSLRRLQVETIDLYQIHWPQPDEDLEEGWAALAELQKEGKVRWIGVSNFDAAQLERVRAIAPVTSLQPPYSLIRREVETDVLPYCKAHGVGVIAYSPMGSGLLTGGMTRERVAALPDDDWRSRADSFREPALTTNLAFAAKLATIGARHNLPAGVIALAWVLKNPAVTGAIVGIRNPAQVENLIGAIDFRLSDEEGSELTPS